MNSQNGKISGAAMRNASVAAAVICAASGGSFARHSFEFQLEIVRAAAKRNAPPTPQTKVSGCMLYAAVPHINPSNTILVRDGRDRLHIAVKSKHGYKQ